MNSAGAKWEALETILNTLALIVLASLLAIVVTAAKSAVRAMEREPTTFTSYTGEQQ